jgi:hypothetical protein
MAAENDYCLPMGNRVAIGITSYDDLASTAVANDVFDALESTSIKLIPEVVVADGAKIIVDGRTAFVTNWLTEVPYVVRANRSKSSEVLRRGHYRTGAEWVRRNSLKSKGTMIPRPERDPTGCDTIELEIAFSKRIDWAGLFDRLVAATRPSFAMLHAFPDGPQSLVLGPDYVTEFVGPIAGEGWFTAWRTPLGTWRVPDSFRVDERRRYLFLPELPWLSHFGPQFSGQYDPDRLIASVARAKRRDCGLTTQLSENLFEAVEHSAAYELALANARSCFRQGFFRLGNRSIKASLRPFPDPSLKRV